MNWQKAIDDFSNKFLDLGFVVLRFFTFYTMINHHLSPPLGRICLELFPSIEESQIQGYIGDYRKP